MCNRFQNFLTLTIACFFFLQVSAQNHFLVELENRAPSVQDLVKGYEGFPSIPFQAKDIKGKQYTLPELKGKTVFLYFWNLNNGTALAQIDALNLMQSRYRDKLQIISFADDDKDSLLSYLKSTPIDFPIIPNSKTLSDGPYGGDLGTPKLFIIDEYGVIKWVFPESSFNTADFNFYNVMETLFKQLNM